MQIHNFRTPDFRRSGGPAYVQRARRAMKQAFDAVRAEIEHVAKRRAEIEADDSRKDDWKAAQIQEVREKSAAIRKQAVADALSALAGVKITVEEAVRVARHRDPLALPPLSIEGLSDSAKPLALEMRRMIDLQTALVRKQARAEALALVERAFLADKAGRRSASGTALIDALRQVVELGDPVLLAEFERVADWRLKDRPDADPMRQLYAAEIALHADAKLGPEEFLLLDHRDDLDSMSVVLEGLAQQADAGNEGTTRRLLNEVPRLFGDLGVEDAA